MTRVVDAVDDWFDARGTAKDSANTVAAYRADIRSVLDAVGSVLDRAPHDVTTDDLDLRTMRRGFSLWARSRKATSVRRGHSTWSGFFAYLVSEGVVAGSPMPGIAKPKAPPRVPKALSREDAARVVAVVEAGVEHRRDPWPEMERAVLLTTLLSGARSAEVLDVNVGDVSLAPGSERMIVEGKTGQRAVPLPAALLTILGAYLDTRRQRFPDDARQRDVRDPESPWSWWRPEVPLFVDRTGQRMQRGALQYMVRTVYTEAGVNATRANGALVHALRHTKATRMAEAGATATEIMQFLGQSSLASAQHYVSATAADVRAAAMRDPSVDSLGT